MFCWKPGVNTIFICFSLGAHIGCIMLIFTELSNVYIVKSLIGQFNCHFCYRHNFFIDSSYSCFQFIINKEFLFLLHELNIWWLKCSSHNIIQSLIVQTKLGRHFKCIFEIFFKDLFCVCVPDIFLPSRCGWWGISTDCHLTVCYSVFCLRLVATQGYWSQS